MAAFDVRLPFACLISGAIIEKKKKSNSGPFYMT